MQHNEINQIQVLLLFQMFIMWSYYQYVTLIIVNSQSTKKNNGKFPYNWWWKKEIKSKWWLLVDNLVNIKIIITLYIYNIPNAHRSYNNITMYITCTNVNMKYSFSQELVKLYSIKSFFLIKKSRKCSFFHQKYEFVKKN